MIAARDAQRLKEEAERNTPEGRKKAAKEAEAEIAEKRQHWGRRAAALPYDGFKGILDSAEDKELQVYTRTYHHEHKFWGIKPVGMSIWDFWDIHDPEVKRYDDANQETPATPEPSTLAPPPINSPRKPRPTAKIRRQQKPSNVNPNNRVKKLTTPSKDNNKTRRSLASKVGSGNPGLNSQVRIIDRALRTHDRPNPEVKRYDDANQETPATPEPATGTPPMNARVQRNKSKAKSRGRQKSSNTNSTHRVKKSTKPKPNKETRKSLADKSDAENSGLEDQMRVVKGGVRARGRPTRNKTAVAVTPAEEKTVKPKTSVQRDVPPKTKRPRGRPPVNAKTTERRSDQKSTPADQGKARITISSRKDTRPPAPSTHAMRTRRAGPAENLQLS